MSASSRLIRIGAAGFSGTGGTPQIIGADRNRGDHNSYSTYTSYDAQLNITGNAACVFVVVRTVIDSGNNSTCALSVDGVSATKLSNSAFTLGGMTSYTESYYLSSVPTGGVIAAMSGGSAVRNHEIYAFMLDNDSTPTVTHSTGSSYATNGGNHLVTVANTIPANAFIFMQYGGADKLNHDSITTNQSTSLAPIRGVKTNNRIHHMTYVASYVVSSSTSFSNYLPYESHFNTYIPQKLLVQF